MYALNDKATNYIKQEVMELKEVNIVSMIVENVNGPFSPIDRIRKLSEIENSASSTNII